MTRQLPDYAGGGIVNLMQSIATACAAAPQDAPLYPELALLPAARLAEARHIVLLVIDGLGRRTLDTHPAPTLRRHTLGTLSSVFPSTTASAITGFMTGLAPAQHGLTGWHMQMDEIDQILSILPLTPRSPPARKTPEELPPLLFDVPTLFQRIGRESWTVAPRHIAGSPFNTWHSRGAQSVAYDTLPELFMHLADLLRADAPPRYIYAYYPELDSLSHRYGTDSPHAQQNLRAIDDAFRAFVASVQGCDSWIVATADHGFIDSPPERVLSLDAHAPLAALLARPLCGERRAAYCYVAPARRAAFEAYIRSHLAHCAELHRSADLIAAGWFGPPPCHPRLAARVGDYTLEMKDNWTIKDWLPGEKRYPMLGVHGGTSADEMRVPLIAVRV